MTTLKLPSHVRNQMTADLGMQTPQNVTEVNVGAVQPVYIIGQIKQPKNIINSDTATYGGVFADSGDTFHFLDEGVRNYIKGKRFRIINLWIKLYAGVTQRAALAGRYVYVDVITRCSGGARNEVDSNDHIGSCLAWIYASAGLTWEWRWSSLYHTLGDSQNSASGHQFLSKPPLIQGFFIPDGFMMQGGYPVFMLRMNDGAAPGSTITVSAGGVIEVEESTDVPFIFPELP